MPIAGRPPHPPTDVLRRGEARLLAVLPGLADSGSDEATELAMSTFGGRSAPLARRPQVAQDGADAERYSFGPVVASGGRMLPLVGLLESAEVGYRGPRGYAGLAPYVGMVSAASIEPPIPRSQRSAGAVLEAAGQLALPLAGAAVGIVTAAALLGGHAPSASLLVTSAALVLPSYGIDRLADVAADAVAYPQRAALYRRRAGLLRGVYLGLGALALATAASAGAWAVAYVAAFPASVLLYALPVLPRRFRIRRAKDIPLGKGVYSAACWAALVPMAALWTGAPLDAAMLLLVAYVFAQVWLTTVVCDLKDEEGDRRVGIVTVPTLLGRARAVGLLRRVNLATALAAVGLATAGLWPGFMVALGLVSATLTDRYLCHLEDPRADLRFVGDVIADGVIALWAPILVLVER